MIINVHMADEARYAWALGGRSIENVVGAIHALAGHGGSDAIDDVGAIHRDLMVLRQLLHDATVAGLRFHSQPTMMYWRWR